MTADTVYKVALALSKNEQIKLLKMLNYKLNHEVDLITDEEADNYLLKNVFGIDV